MKYIRLTCIFIGVILKENIVLKKITGGFKVLNKDMLEKAMKFSQKPALFEKGTGNIWTEPYLANQMLECHLDRESDASSRREELIDKTVNFINECVKEGSTILDLGCGPGLYAEKLTRMGHKVTGVDFSENSITYARCSAKQNGLDINYMCRDILSLENTESYDVVMQIYGEVNTFSETDRDKLFEVVHSALKPEGVFIFDVTTPNRRDKERIHKEWSISEKGFWRKDSHLVLEEEYEYENDIWLEQYIVIDESDVTIYRNWFHEYNKESIENVLLKAGFSEVQVIENLYEREKKDNTDWLTVIASK